MFSAAAFNFGPPGVCRLRANSSPGRRAIDRKSPARTPPSLGFYRRPEEDLNPHGLAACGFELWPGSLCSESLQEAQSCRMVIFIWVLPPFKFASGCAG